MKFNLVPREEASEMVLTVLIWAVASLLSTRLYLKITGYPIIGLGAWHVAHALIGGLIMAAGMIVTLTLHGSRIRKTATVIFGIGLGLFIDEIGKYLSRDNDYFFRPAIILIYFIFIAMFLLYRYFRRKARDNPKTWLYQVISQIEEVIEGDFEVKEKEAMMRKLKKIITSTQGQTKDFAQRLQSILKNARTIEDKNESWGLMTWKELRSQLYSKFFKKRVFWYFLAILTLIYVAGGILDYLYLIPRFQTNEFIDFWFREQDLVTRTDIVLFNLKAVADAGTAVMFILGSMAAFRRRIKEGIGFFQYGLLINIFLSSVFKFYFEQFSGVFGLFGSIILYSGLAELRKEMAK